MDYAFESIGPTLRIVVLLFLFVAIAVAVAVLIGLAALPGILARKRHHRQAEAINLAGWLGLPTGIVWVLAIIWAYTRPIEFRAAAGSPADSPSSPSLAALQQQVAALESLVTRLESNLASPGKGAKR